MSRLDTTAAVASLVLLLSCSAPPVDPVEASRDFARRQELRCQPGDPWSLVLHDLLARSSWCGRVRVYCDSSGQVEVWRAEGWHHGGTEVLEVVVRDGAVAAWSQPR